jgi:serine/threonine protein kinase
VPRGENRGLTYTVAQPLVGRYALERFHASLGRHLFLEGRDRRTGTPVLVKCVLRYDVQAPARTGDREGFTGQLRAARKALEAERRLLVLLRDSGCYGVPLPSDFVFDLNPQLEGPYPTEDLDEWYYDDAEMMAAEPYLVQKGLRGKLLEDVLAAAPEGRLPEERARRIVRQAAEVLRLLHRPYPVRAGMTWQLVYQNLKPANVWLDERDGVTLLHLDGCQLTNRETGLKLLPGTCSPGYCAPEAERGQAVLTPAADVYGLGVLYFQLLSGSNPRDLLPPGHGAAPRAVTLEPGLLDGRCRPATRALVERCLAPDPGQRYPTAEAVLQALNKD